MELGVDGDRAITILLEADTPRLRAAEGGVRFQLHNPTATDLTCRVRTPPAWPGEAAFDAVVEVARGQTRWFWARGSELKVLNRREE